jgi:hypothetical protein
LLDDIDDTDEEDEADSDDLLLDDKLLTLLITLLALDIEETDETLVELLTLDKEETEETLDAWDDVADVLLTLPLPAAFDELLPAVPPEHAAVSNAIAVIGTIPKFLITFLMPYTGVTQSNSSDAVIAFLLGTKAPQASLNVWRIEQAVILVVTQPAGSSSQPRR